MSSGRLCMATLRLRNWVPQLYDLKKSPCEKIINDCGALNVTIIRPAEEPLISFIPGNENFLYSRIFNNLITIISETF